MPRSLSSDGNMITVRGAGGSDGRMLVARSGLWTLVAFLLESWRPNMVYVENLLKTGHALAR